MNKHLLLPIFIVATLAAGIGWAEYTSWKEIAELQRQLHSPALARILARGEQWPSADYDALRALLVEAQVSLSAFRGWLLVSCISLLLLVAVLAYSIQRWMIAPLESQLLASHAVIARQEKLASLGVLAAGVAHEIRNPLTALKARIFSQTKRLRLHSPEHADAVFIKGEIDRLEQIVKDFLQFARPGEPALAPVEASGFLAHLREQMSADLNPGGITLCVDAPEGLWLKIDAAQIKQVMINLIRNAAESIGRDGTITLRARATFLPFAPWRLPAIALEVEDTGAGIPSEVQDRLFDPFFTTKESGTGLGLAIAERIVQKHGGALQFRTQAQRGTLFSVLLPAAPSDEFTC